jgi:sensor histidine kinase YesM
MRKAVRSLLGMLNYRQKLVLAITLLMLAPISVAGAIVVAQIWNEKKDTAVKNSEAFLEDSVRQVDDFTVGVLTKIEFIRFNPVIGRILTTDYTNRYNDMVKDYGEARYFVRALNPQAAGNEEQFKVSIYAFNPTAQEGGIFKTGRPQLLKDAAPSQDGGPSDQYASNMMMPASAQWVFAPAQGNGELSRANIYAYSMMRGINRELGITEIRISMLLLLRNMPELSIPNSFLAFVDQEGNAYPSKSAPEQEEVFAGAYASYRAAGKTRGYIAMERPLRENGCSLVLFVDNDYIASQIKPLILTAGFAMLALLLLTCGIVYGVAYLLTNRLSSLVSGLVLNDEEGAPVLRKLTMQNGMGRDEIALIAEKLSRQMESIRYYYEKTAQMEVKEKKLEIENLQATIDPHFLYNTLSSIKWAFGNQELAFIIDKLVKYYRIALNRGKMIYPLRSEFEMLAQYLEIQKFSYNRPFLYAFQAEPEAEACLIVKNLLQPIVENAFIHGVNLKKSGGEILISAKRDGDWLSVVIADNGPGIPEEKLLQINQSLLDGASGGYGLYNAHARIRAYYGEPYGLRVENLDEGAVVTVTLPAVSKPAESGLGGASKGLPGGKQIVPSNSAVD